MAPELRLNKGKASFESDLFSLAVTLNELLTGELSDEPGSDLSGPLGKLIRTLGHKDPTQRAQALSFDVSEYDKETELQPKIHEQRSPQNHAKINPEKHEKKEHEVNGHLIKNVIKNLRERQRCVKVRCRCPCRIV